MFDKPSSEVFRRAVDGDKTALHDLVGRYRPLVRLIAARHARRVLGRRYDESDIVQMTCLEALTGFDAFRGATQAEFTAWLEGILERTLLRLWRHSTAQKRDFRRESFESGSNIDFAFGWANSLGTDPAQKIVAGELAVMLANAMDSLPAEYRAVVELRFVDGRHLREVADQLGVSVGVVAGRLRRGVTMLYEQLPSEARDCLEMDQN